MDTVLKQLENLAALARREDSPVPLDVSAVMARVRGLEIDEQPDVLLLGFFAGGVAAAAIALAIGLPALTAWSDMSSPVTLLTTLPEALELLQ